MAVLVVMVDGDGVSGELATGELATGELATGERTLGGPERVYRTMPMLAFLYGRRQANKTFTPDDGYRTVSNAPFFNTFSSHFSKVSEPMSNVTLDEGLVQSDSVSSILDSALDAGGGLLRLTPTWVPRSFLHPGRRIKLHPGDYYRFGADRGGIDERWFGSTTEAANEGRVWHEGLSFCLFEGKKFLLRDAVAERGADLVGAAIFDQYKRWPVYSKFFDNMGPIPHHMHQTLRGRGIGGPGGQTRELLFPAPAEQRRQQLCLHVHGARTGHQTRRRAALSRKLERRRQRHSRPQPSLSSQTGYRLVDSARRAARTRIALHLRTAMGQRRVRDVPVDRRRPLCSLVAAGQRHARGKASRSRLHRRPARLGQERRYAFQGEQLPGTDPRRRPQR